MHDTPEDRPDGVSDGFQQPGEEIPGRVRERQGVVLHVGVRVQGLEVRRVLDERIGGQEPAELRVVHPPIHVHEADGVELFVTCVAPGDAPVLPDGRGHVQERRPGHVAALAPGIEGEPVRDGTRRIGDHVGGPR